MLLMLDILDQWQTLIGSLIGALVGLVSALVVAGRVERREDLASGMLLISVLSPVSAASSQLRKLADERSIYREEDRILFMAEKLAKLRPRFPEPTELAAIRLMPIDNVMAAHLTFFVYHYREFEEKIRLVELAYQASSEGHEVPEMRGVILLKSRAAMRNFFGASIHGKFAAALIAKFVLSKTPTFNNLIAKCGLDSQARAAKEALKKEVMESRP